MPEIQGAYFLADQLGPGRSFVIGKLIFIKFMFVVIKPRPFLPV